jgi:hypothetical protein
MGEKRWKGPKGYEEREVEKDPPKKDPEEEFSRPVSFFREEIP